MNKSKLNIIINAVMFICLMAVAGMGFLMKFVLIPGQERWVKYGENVELSLFGLDRHEWGTIHLILGFALLALLIVHIILHWNVILCTYKKIIPNAKIRILVTTSFIILCFLLLTSPFLVNTSVNEISRGNGRQTAKRSSIMKKDLINSDQGNFTDNQEKDHLRKHKNLREVRKYNYKDNRQKNEKNRNGYGRRGNRNRRNNNR
ncbi:MAG: DUF4405 domain-containing protein [Bacteroidales bacterium]|nr:DUF4405 domain-containing protein [Bacteroidales bacterium]